jgi:hypothetical protein
MNNVLLEISDRFKRNIKLVKIVVVVSIVYIFVIGFLSLILYSKNKDYVKLEYENNTLLGRTLNLEQNITALNDEKKRILDENDNFKSAMDTIKYGEQKITNTIINAYRNNQIDIAKSYIEFSLKYFPESLNITEIERYDILIKQIEEEEKQKVVSRQNERNSYISQCKTFSYQAIYNFPERYIGQKCGYTGLVTNKFRDGDNIYFLLVTGIDKNKIRSEMNKIKEEMAEHPFRYFFSDEYEYGDEEIVNVIRGAYINKIFVSAKLSSANDNIANEDEITVYGEYMGVRSLTLSSEQGNFPYITTRYINSGNTLNGVPGIGSDIDFYF